MKRNNLLVLFIVVIISATVFAACFIDYKNSGPAIQDRHSLSRAHIDPTIEWSKENVSLITNEMNVSLKSEKILPGIIYSCDLTGPLRVDSLEISAGPDISASAIFSLYKEEIDDSRFDYYLVWMKAEGSSNSDNRENASRLTDIHSGIILDRSDDWITDWSPFKDSTGGVPHEETIQLGKCMSISENYTVKQGRTGVESLSTGSNSTADFIIQWQGNYFGTQAIISGTEIQVPKNAGYNYSIVLGVRGLTLGG